MANPIGRFSQHDKQIINWNTVIHEKYFIYNIFNSTAFFGDKKNIISNNCILGLDQSKIFRISICKNLQQIFYLYHKFEIGSRGHVTRNNRITLAELCHMTGVRKPQQVIRNCSKIVLLGSYTIFNARNSQDWSAGQPYLKP